MAGRRMFARTVVTTGRFARLSAGAQALYYALGMEADDDGFAEGLMVLRMFGREEADLRDLEKMGYVKVYGEDLITYIVDWDTNNQIRKDRYRESRYAYLLNEEPEETPRKAVSSGEAEFRETKSVQAEAREQAEGTQAREMGPQAAGIPGSADLRTLEGDQDAGNEVLPARSLGTGREATEITAPAKEMTERELMMMRARLRKDHAEEKRQREKEALREKREKQGLYYIDIDRITEEIESGRRDKAGGRIGPRQEAAG